MSRRDKDKRRELQEQEWIQMHDLSDPQNQGLSRKFAELQGKNYSQSNNYNNRSNIDFNSPNQNYPKQQIAQRNNKQNGRVSQGKREKRVKKPSIPMMFVTCDFCTVVQNVPGNTQLYTCGSCQNMSECEPLYGVFTCGHCQAKVCYGFGISVMIKCPKCLSVNKVPSQAQKKYQSSTKKPSVQRQRVRQEQRYKQSQRLYEY